MTKTIIILGDTHTLHFLHMLNGIQDFVVIGVGDHGEHETQHVGEFQLKQISDYCKDHNGEIYLVRGNHSNPAWFDWNYWANQFERVHFVPDNTVINIQGKNVLFSGGAISVNRQELQLDYDYWADEKFQPDFGEYPKIDFLITHMNQMNNGFENIAHYFKDDNTLKQELLDELELSVAFREHVKPKIGHFWGHYHTDYLQYYQGVRNQCVNKDSMVDVTRLFQ